MKTSARILLIGIWGIICGMILAAPFLMKNAFPAAATALYFPFSFFCHQIPDRSFMLNQFPLAVCHRCLGIYLGLFLGALWSSGWIYDSVKRRCSSVLIAVLPMGIDFSLDFLGFWNSAPALRFATGLIFGYLISPLLVRGFTELLQDISWRSPAIKTMPIKGDVS